MQRRTQYIPLALTVILLTILVFTPAATFAQGTIPTQDAIGTIETPPGVDVINTSSKVGADGIGALYFISMMIRLAIIVGGLWAFLNIVMAGWTFITSSGNAQAHTKARDQITMSVIGLLLMASIYTMAGVIGLVFFGDASFILNPQISGPV